MCEQSLNELWWKETSVMVIDHSGSRWTDSDYFSL